MTDWTNQGCHPWPEPDCPTCAEHADRSHQPRNAKPRRKTSRWGNLHLHRKHVDGCYRCELNTDEETTQ